MNFGQLFPYIQNKLFCKRIAKENYLQCHEKLSLNLVLIINVYPFFDKQLGSDLSPQNCLYFQGFRGLKLFNGCFVV